MELKEKVPVAVEFIYYKDVITYTDVFNGHVIMSFIRCIDIYEDFKRIHVNCTYYHEP